jgi:hypothetical protein
MVRASERVARVPGPIIAIHPRGLTMLRWAIGVSLAVVVGVVGQAAHGQVVNSEWNAGNGNWNVPANCFDRGARQRRRFRYNVQIGNRPVAASGRLCNRQRHERHRHVTTVSNNAD